MRRSALVMLVGLLATAGCGKKASDHSGESNRGGGQTITAANYPLAYLAQRIVGSDIEVLMPVPTDVHPHAWKPTEDDIKQMQRGGPILLNGANYSGWLVKVTLPKSKLVDTSADFVDRYEYLVDLAVHQHGPEGEHEHRGFAPEFWLSPQLAKMQAQSILKAVSQRWPDRSETFKKNFAGLASDLDQLASEYETFAEKHADVTVISMQPKFKYLSAELGWKDLHLHWPDDPENESRIEKQLKKIDGYLKKEAPKFVFWVGEVPARAAEVLAKKSVVPISLRVADHQPPGQDLLDVLQHNLNQIRAAVSE